MTPGLRNHLKFHAGYKIRKAGVTLSSLELAEKASRRLWSDTQYEDHRRLMRTMDSINERFGRDVARCGIYPSEGVWRTRFETRSPRYTTSLDEVCVIALEGADGNIRSCQFLDTFE